MTRKTTQSFLRSALAAVLLATLVPASASAVPTTEWRDYTLIAEDRIRIGTNLNLSGNFAVWGAGGTLLLGINTFQLDDAPPPFVAADTLNLAGQASVANAYTNQVTGNATGEVRGVTLPDTFPLSLNVPSFPAINACDSCALNEPQLTVDPGDSVTLTPGCYGELFARSSASVFLQPGVYTFLRWDIQKFASVTANGPVTIFIREKIDTEEGNFLGAASGQVDDFMVFIAARKSCLPTSSATNSSIGKFSVAIGTFVAPEDDDFNFNKGVILVGTTVAREIDVRGQHEDRPATPTPTPQNTPTPTPTGTPNVNNTPTPTPQSSPTPTPQNTPTPTPQGSPTPTPQGSPTPTPNGPTPTPSVTPTPNFPTPTPTQPFTPPTPTPNGPTPTPNATRTPRILPTPTPTQPFTPPTPTPLPTINPPPPTTTAAPRKHPWGKKSGLIESLFPSRTGSRIAPSMKRPLGVRR